VPGHHVHRSLWNLDNLFWQPEYFKLVFWINFFNPSSLLRTGTGGRLLWMR
jgi:hypothetical protein